MALQNAIFWSETFRPCFQMIFLEAEKPFSFCFLLPYFLGEKFEQAIMKHIGDDCSQDFDFHSKNGQDLWKNFRIGRYEKTNCVNA